MAVGCITASRGGDRMLAPKGRQTGAGAETGGEGTSATVTNAVPSQAVRATRIKPRIYQLLQCTHFSTARTALRARPSAMAIAPSDPIWQAGKLRLP